MSRNRFVSSGPRSRLYTVCVKITSVRAVRRLHEALKEILLEATVDRVGVDGIRGFQSWFFGGRGLCLRRAADGHEVNPSPTIPRHDHEVFICYECYRMLGFDWICRKREIYRSLSRQLMARTAAAKRTEKVQLNIRVDGEVLARFREYCLRNGLDPQGQIVLFMQRVLETEFDFQQRLWSALKEESS